MVNDVSFDAGEIVALAAASPDETAQGDEVFYISALESVPNPLHSFS